MALRAAKLLLLTPVPAPPLGILGFRTDQLEAIVRAMRAGSSYLAAVALWAPGVDRVVVWNWTTPIAAMVADLTVFSATRYRYKIGFRLKAQ